MGCGELRILWNSFGIDKGKILRCPTLNYSRWESGAERGRLMSS